MKQRNYLIISVEHPSISMLRVEINGVVAKHKTIKGLHYFVANNNSKVEVFFEPWGIKPIVRFNHHLVNYALAKIDQYDHVISFIADITYLDDYFKKNIEFKEKFLCYDEKNYNLIKDQFVGIGVDYSKQEQEILKKFNQ